MPTALIMLASGFEEIEAVSVIDILRRAGVKLFIAGVNGSMIAGAHGIKLQSDTEVGDIKTKDFDVVILPGGNEGVENLKRSQDVREIISRQNQKEKLIAAICAAPTLLDDMGLLEGRRATCYPANRAGLKSAVYLEDTVVQDDHFLTSRGPGTAMAFAYAILERLALKAQADQLREGMLAPAYA